MVMMVFTCFNSKWGKSFSFTFSNNDHQWVILFNECRHYIYKSIVNVGDLKHYKVLNYECVGDVKENSDTEIIPAAVQTQIFHPGYLDKAGDETNQKIRKSEQNPNFWWNFFSFCFDRNYLIHLEDTGIIWNLCKKLSIIIRLNHCRKRVSVSF